MPLGRVIRRSEFYAFWLECFDDETLARMGATLFGVGDAAAVGSWRERLRLDRAE